MGRRARRLIAVASLVMALAGFAVSPVSAVTVELNIAAHYTPTGYCETGLNEFGNDIRCAYEFKVPNLPFGAKVTKATFFATQSWVDNDGRVCDPCPVAVAGYVGDGAGQASDLTAGTTLGTMNANGDHADHDVSITSLVAGIVDDGKQFVGIRMNATDPSVLAASTKWARLWIVMTYVITAPIHVGFDSPGSGSVTSSPAGLSCPSTCFADFVVGKTVTVTAKAAAGSRFAGWNDYYCRGQDSTCTFVVEPAEQWIVPIFEKSAAAGTPRPATPAPSAATGEASPAASAAASDVPETSSVPLNTSAPGTPAPTVAPIPASPTSPPSTSPTSNVSGGGPILLLLIAIAVLAAGVAIRGRLGRGRPS